MIITLRPGTTKRGVEDVVQKIKELGFTFRISKGTGRTIITITGENAIRSRRIFEEIFVVESIAPIINP